MKYYLFVSIAALALMFWLGMEPWLPGQAERFYVLVPPTFLGLVLVKSPASWTRKVRRGRVLGWRLGFVLLVACGVLAGLYQLGWVPSAQHWELLFFVYFLTGVGIVVLSLRHGVRSLCARLAVRVTPGSRRHGILTEGLPLAILVALVAPYLMGVSYVHRVKIIPQSNPLAIFQRPYDDVEFRTTDNLTLRGWFVPATAPSPRTLVVCHGLGANRENFLSFLHVADRLGANALFFDFRGHGASDGHTVSMGLREKDDVLSAIDYLRTRRPEQTQELFGLGVSMGCGALILAAADVEPPLQGLILDSGMANVLELTDNILTIFPQAVRPWLTGLGVPIASWHAACSLEDLCPELHIARVRAPVLVIHSLSDRLIPPQHGQRLYDHAVEPKQIFLAPTHGHADVYGARHEEYLERVCGFFGGTESFTSRTHGK